jgi:hypothetical protein
MKAVTQTVSGTSPAHAGTWSPVGGTMKSAFGVWLQSAQHETSESKESSPDSCHSLCHDLSAAAILKV